MTITLVDRRMIAQTEEVRKSSHDPHRQVGVVIANGASIISTGANEPPHSLALTPAVSRRLIAEDPDWKYFVLEHAERNAIFSAWRSGAQVAGSTMYGTLFPCADCARAIAAAGIRRLVVPKPGGDSLRDRKWAEHYQYAGRILNLARVTVDFFDPAEFSSFE